VQALADEAIRRFDLSQYLTFGKPGNDSAYYYTFSVLARQAVPRNESMTILLESREDGNLIRSTTTNFES
jgi:hypothetical protein